mmetsp:Transcript_59961/g.125410  ORF Transcript_59961/g.125410 Transcript_59961/m.125410 type:complete len:217 (-) Transcript_59961:3221-3871(-)
MGIEGGGGSEGGRGEGAQNRDRTGPASCASTLRPRSRLNTALPLRLVRHQLWQRQQGRPLAWSGRRGVPSSRRGQGDGSQASAKANQEMAKAKATGILREATGAAEAVPGARLETGSRLSPQPLQEQQQHREQELQRQRIDSRRCWRLLCQRRLRLQRGGWRRSVTGGCQRTSEADEAEGCPDSHQWAAPPRHPLARSRPCPPARSRPAVSRWAAT